MHETRASPGPGLRFCQDITASVRLSLSDVETVRRLPVFSRVSSIWATAALYPMIFAAASGAKGPRRAMASNGELASELLT